MPRLIWCMLIVGAFGTGLAVASLHYSAATRVPAEPLANVRSPFYRAKFAHRKLS